MITGDRRRACIAVLICLVLVVTGVGCSKQATDPPRQDFPGTPVEDAPPPAPVALMPWYIDVTEGRTRDYRGIAGGSHIVSDGDSILVGEGDVVVDLVLFKGASLDAIKPFIDVTPASVTYNAGEMNEDYLVQVWWSGESGAAAQRMTFRLRQGAPVGAGVTSKSGVAVTIERRQEAVFTVAEVGNEDVRTPYQEGHGSYAIAPGAHTFRMAFTKDVDRASVEATVAKRLNEIVGGLPLASALVPEFRWSGARTVDITVTLPEHGGYFLVTAEWAVDCDGVGIWPVQPLALRVARPIKVVAVAPEAPSEAEHVMTLRPGHRVGAISGDGKTVVALEAPYGPDSELEGPEQLLTFLYQTGSEPRELSATLGRVGAVGLASDGLIWAWSTNTLHVRVDTEGRLVEKRAYDFWPAGWAVSGDGMTVAYFDRSSGYEDLPFSNDPVWFDLFVYHPGTGKTERYQRVAQFPNSYDFYGPAITMAFDRAGKTLVFMDSSQNAARIARVDLATGRVSYVAEGALGRWGSLTISPDGRLAAMLIPEDTEKWLIVDLTSGAMRTVTVSGERGLFSPDGSKLVLACAGTVTLVDVSSGAITDLGEGQPVGWSYDGSRLYVARPES